MKWLIPILAARAFACQPVEGDRILGKDLAAANSTFAALGPDLAIGFTPLAGVQRTLLSGELARIAREHGISTSGPVAPVCFERITEHLTVERLLPVLRLAFEKAAAGREEAPFEIVDFSRYGVPRGALEFNRSGLGSTGLWRGRVIYAEGRSTPIWAKIRLASVQPAPFEVERGDTVQVEVSSGSALVTFEAKADTTGHAGELIILRNPENGRPFRARVEAKGKVSIQE